MSTKTPDPERERSADPFVRTTDPLIDEVRRARRLVEERHGNDLRAHVDALRKLQEEWGTRIISGREGAAKRAV
ncbi:MAG: hypothetical protein K2W85_09625 [Phycisphaerales bacterium]|nr:hypothetical protein [Phycisphaerales bacterium]